MNLRVPESAGNFLTGCTQCAVVHCETRNLCVATLSLSVCAKCDPWCVVQGLWHTNTNPHGRLNGHRVTLWPLHLHMLYV